MEEIHGTEFSKRIGNHDKCVVFDFDCTLTYTHCYYLLNSYEKGFQPKHQWSSVTQQCNLNTNADINNMLRNWNTYREELTQILFGGIDRLNMIKSFLDFILSKGYDIYISSKGICRDIEYALSFFGLRHYITEINANGGPCVEMSKPEYIVNILIDSRNYKNIIYIDDDSGEDAMIKYLLREKPRDVNYKYIGPDIGLYKDQNGLTHQMISMLINYIESVNMHGGSINMNNFYKQKYRKYKRKYLNIK
jgi:2-hydroxy-3-keto-5-methylthiopentenyl-1-phosphate phosphatase